MEIDDLLLVRDVGMFQCSSASRKFLNAERNAEPRALNKFQCSSASRKFLNHRPGVRNDAHRLFQCSSASRKFLNQIGYGALELTDEVSVLFSEPKIPQLRAA